MESQAFGILVVWLVCSGRAGLVNFDAALFHNDGPRSRTFQVRTAFHSHTVDAVLIVCINAHLNHGPLLLLWLAMECSHMRVRVVCVGVFPPRVWWTWSERGVVCRHVTLLQSPDRDKIPSRRIPCSRFIGCRSALPSARVGSESSHIGAHRDESGEGAGRLQGKEWSRDGPVLEEERLALRCSSAPGPHGYPCVSIHKPFSCFTSLQEAQPKCAAVLFSAPVCTFRSTVVRLSFLSHLQQLRKC